MALAFSLCLSTRNGRGTEMRILIVEDEFVSRKKAHKILSDYGDCDITVNGNEAVEAFRLAAEEGEPYDLITMDILMPDMNGVEALKKIRELEEARNIMLGKGVKVVMLTATRTGESVTSSFHEGCEAYIVKPFNREKLVGALEEVGLA